ncbi:DUF3800 domain-containing protein [Corynebacterium hesseae]|uniref:DUF3800 domain-containing protein n=1 Tax=Corynebacterium hesseae TaxID=2913502 RepID=A0ABU9UM32_9CORY
MEDVKRKRTLYVFLDESGDMQFGAKASTHFLITAFCTFAPASTAIRLQALKYELMAAGSKDLEFHATENSKGTRKRVIDRINELDRCRVHTIWVDKRMTHPTYQSPPQLLGLFAGAMGKWINAAWGDSEVGQVILIFDSVLTGKERSAFEKRIKPLLKGLQLEFRVLFHPVKQDLNGQIADYFSWSWFQKMERGKEQYVQALSSRHNWDQFNMFSAGKTYYWSGPVRK